GVFHMRQMRPSTPMLIMQHRTRSVPRRPQTSPKSHRLLEGQLETGEGLRVTSPSSPIPRPREPGQVASGKDQEPPQRTFEAFLCPGVYWAQEPAGCRATGEARMCGGGNATWTGRNRCRCRLCHETFGGLKGCDAHRPGECKDPASLALTEKDGVWMELD